MRYAIPSEPSEILRSRHVDVVPYAARVRALSERLGVDFSSTLYAYDTVPLCQQRDAHAAMRRETAELIAARTGALRAAIPGLIDAHCAVLCGPGRVDVMRTVLAPLVSDALSVLVEAPLDPDEDEHVSRVFSQAMGVAKRRKVEDALTGLRARLREALPEAEERVLGLKLALAILGRDAMLGTFACTLHDLVAGLDGAPWSALDWPDMPTRTGVPFVDRVALQDVSVDGEAVDAGGSIRAQLDVYETAADPRDRLAFFGAGAHTCLGRALTLDLWRAFASMLARSGARPRVADYALRRDDVFHIPQTFVLEIATP
ncbi:hypothetical protein [Citreimonas salinaria]|uniref:Cytochrome P450 n=1 Tax=Citreimonas salinaria TaxID=321339 RepID=A0A1H3LSE7_9RHOB|nr:hypothetical protein [Citreimonas salinaria]SDY66908.1 hypothetical protein SAMN05444340_11416 [Citreimonas salinaria]